MKLQNLKLILLLNGIFILFFTTNNKIYSQEEEIPDSLKSWQTTGYTSLTFNQTSFSNWVRGGDNNVAASGIFNLNTNYNKGNFSWENTVDIAYGILTSDQYSLRKTDDKIDVNSKFGYQTPVKNTFYTAIVNFRSQFADGFDYPDDSTIVSAALAPAFIITSIGIDYKPSDVISVYLSPVTGRYIIMNDQNLANKGAFGVEPAKYDENGNMISEGQQFKADFGAYATVELKFDVMENIKFKSKIDLFNDYTDEDKNNRKNIDVNFESVLFMKVNKFISANIFLQLLYDHEQKVPVYENIAGEKVVTGESPKLQIKQILGIGLTYNFKI